MKKIQGTKLTEYDNDDENQTQNSAASIEGKHCQ